MTSPSWPTTSRNLLRSWIKTGLTTVIFALFTLSHLTEATPKDDYFLFEDHDQPTREPAGITTSQGLPDFEEPKKMWTEAKGAFRRGMYLDVKRLIERILHRHPGTIGGLDARFLLALTYLKLEEPEKAIEPLKAYVQHHSGDIKEFQGRLRLSEAYLKLKKPHEAFLSVDAVVGQHRTRRKLPKALQLEALGLKAQSQLALGQLENSQRTMSAFHEQAKGTLRKLRKVRAAGKVVGLDIHLRHCSRYASHVPLDEAQVIDQMARRGYCVEEALLLVKNIVDERASRWTRQAVELISQGTGLYWDACQRPPRPPRRLASTQMRRYREELADRLIGRCLETKKRMHSMVDAWLKQPLVKSKRTYGRLKKTIDRAMSSQSVTPKKGRKTASVR